ncbi:D-inositol-3-phosphate glycosyltransferase [Jiangella aurantiaca]|uniref:D-inositol-3-phosphate glycosyltransferase n=1 Tax=Jiangella aurantiaca TaxID=2530373 RepID=A0A4R5A2W1_9ACTN|nr:D-inositol-3-phosphate glycosyltransferase [Jiangella aurantiaca]TDD66141.1 D-inositol-3-phosphate glycosyltransferase [Jiangella aurantiaca]
MSGTRGPRRVMMLSVHTSPLDQPGGGNAGGMNVYVVELARRLAALGVEVEVFTRATASGQPPVVQTAPGVLVRHIAAGPYELLPVAEVPAQLCAFTSGVLRAEAKRLPGWYDLVHSHYWLSGHVGWLATSRWGVPLVHSMHTMSKVKNLSLADGELPEPRERELGEEQVVAAADLLVASTDDEAAQLVGLYGADPAQVATIPPGVDLDVFAPGPAAAARARLGLPADAVVLLFAGRIQPLKAPDVLVRAASLLVTRDPALRERLVVAVVGGPSGSGLAEPHALTRLAHTLDVADVVRFEPPVDQRELADWYRAADLTAVPSYSESFGLVALESQACGTPVVAAAVGGLRTAVAHDVSGLLVEGHDPADWADAVAGLIGDPDRLRRLGTGAVAHAAEFGWDATAARMLDVYTTALRHRQVMTA